MARVSIQMEMVVVIVVAKCVLNGRSLVRLFVVEKITKNKRERERERERENEDRERKKQRKRERMKDRE